MNNFTHLDIPADEWVEMTTDECAVAYHRFPHHGTPSTPAEIAQYLGVSVERVSVIETKLRKHYITS